MPTTHPRACEFAGPELDELWITSCAGGSDGRALPLSARLRGLDPLPYWG